MKLSAAAVPVVWLLALAGPVASEELKVGARVRFKAPSLSSQRMQGTVLSVTESAFTIRLADQEDATVVPRSSVDKLEVKTREGKRFIGGLIGLLAGTAIGTLALAGSDDGEFCNSTGCHASISALFLGVPGAAIGAMVAPGERWETVSTGAVSVWVAPRRDRGVEASLSVRF